MRRREFVAGLASAAAWPCAGRAQLANAAVLGLLNGVAFDGPYAAAVAAIRRGLDETGYVEGRNLAVEYRTADGRYARLPELVADLIRSKECDHRDRSFGIRTRSQGRSLGNSDRFCDGTGCRGSRRDQARSARIQTDGFNDRPGCRLEASGIAV